MADDQDPIRSFLEARAEAVRAGEPWEGAACALATVEAGRPSVRMVLSKEVDAAGFRIYTNLESRKGRELRESGAAALVFHWDRVRTSFRVEGSASLLSPAEADAYFAGRPRDSQLGAWASAQSRALTSRDELLARVEAASARYAGVAVPRPPHWGGFLVTPDRIERWIEGAARLHERTLWERDASGWRISLLQP